MAVKIRLKRMGAKKAPFYRVVVADSRSPRDGKIIENLGYYNPITNPSDIKIDTEKAIKWLNNGAIPTDTVTVKEFESSDDDIILLEVLISKDDIGRVIGKDGKIIGSIRTIVQAAASLNMDKKVNINIDSY